ncbi:MAG: hypothetical protein QM820_34370 [Minicystis sp.]
MTYLAACRASEQTAQDHGAPPSSATTANSAAVDTTKRAFETKTGEPGALTPEEARVPAQLALPAPKRGPANCERVRPGERRLSDPSRENTCVALDGWWAVGALVVPETRNGIAGERVLRPFSYVRETNPSLGWPSWAALDTILVDCGWASSESAVTTSASDPLFSKSQDHLRGWVRRVSTITKATWQPLLRLLEHPGTYPFGETLEGTILELRVD